MSLPPYGGLETSGTYGILMDVAKICKQTRIELISVDREVTITLVI
jgi:hypothetical protein